MKAKSMRRALSALVAAARVRWLQTQSKTQVRLHKRHWHLTCRGVMAAKVKVALARELVGFVWDLLRQVPAKKT